MSNNNIIIKKLIIIVIFLLILKVDSKLILKICSIVSQSYSCYNLILSCGDIASVTYLSIFCAHVKLLPKQKFGRAAIAFAEARI